MQGYLLATRRQTIGKWLVGTCIVRADNDEVPTLARTLSLRYGTLALRLPVTLSVLVLAGVLPHPNIVAGLIDIALIFRRDRRCLHDLIAGTKVVGAVTGYKCVMRADLSESKRKAGGQGHEGVRGRHGPDAQATTRPLEGIACRGMLNSRRYCFS
jgi:hypothetical protein